MSSKLRLDIEYGSYSINELSSKYGIDIKDVYKVVEELWNEGILQDVITENFKGEPLYIRDYIVVGKMAKKQDNINIPKKKNKTNQQLFIDIVNKYTPEQLLAKRSINVSEEEMKTIQLLRENFSDPVINVLIDYSIRLNILTLNNSLCEEIGKRWFPKNIKEAEQAMDLARKEYYELIEKTNNRFLIENYSDNCFEG